MLVISIPEMFMKTTTDVGNPHACMNMTTNEKEQQEN